MKTITIRQKTKAEGFDIHCSAMHELPYIIEVDGKPLENVRRFELILDNDSADGFIDLDRIAEYTVTHYGMTFDDLADGAEDPGRENKSSGN